MRPDNHGMQQQPQQVIIVKQQSNGCLITALVFVFFGWIGLAVMAVWKVLGWAWQASVALMRWTWQASVASVQWTARGASWLTARYGWRGWAVVGAVVVALAILSAITGNH